MKCLQLIVQFNFSHNLLANLQEKEKCNRSAKASDFEAINCFGMLGTRRMRTLSKIRKNSSELFGCLMRTEQVGQAATLH